MPDLRSLRAKAGTALPEVRVRRLARATTTTLDAERSVFLSAFLNRYRSLSGEELRLPAKETVEGFLNGAFDKEQDAFETSGDDGAQRFYTARVHEEEGRAETTAGFLSVDLGDGGRDVYLRQMAVSPQWQKRGVGRKLVQFAVGDVGEVRKVTVSVRRSNEDAIRFYCSVGFGEDEHCHDGLDPDLYCGMVWERAAPGAVE